MSKEKTAPRPKLQRLRDWDEARYSITPPAAALDTRLTVAHLRILMLLGRVNTKQGWCEAAQTEIAELTGLKRKTINEALGELVKWGFVQMRTREQTGGNFCHYRVRIEGDDMPVITGTPSKHNMPVITATPAGNGGHRSRSRPTPPSNKLARAQDQKIKRSAPEPARVKDLKLVLGSEGEPPSRSPPKPVQSNATAWAARRRSFVTTPRDEVRWRAWMEHLSAIERDDLACEARTAGSFTTPTMWPTPPDTEKLA